MPVAIGPVDLAFALLKSARVSTAGAIRARYHGTPRRVLFKASSVDLSQDARALRVKEKVIAIVSTRQSTNGGEQWIRQRSMPGCTRRCAFKAIRGITSGMGLKETSWEYPNGTWLRRISAFEFLSQFRDLIVDRRVHKVYLYAFPPLVILQVFCMQTYLHGSAWWVRIGTV